MKLTELQPQFVDYGGVDVRDSAGQPVPERIGVGITFECPCGCDRRCYIPFVQPLDGGAPVQTAHPLWQRTGETFETLTLRPSILRSKERGGCGWHGFITNGDVTSC